MIKLISFSLAVSNISGRTWGTVLQSEAEPVFSDGAGILRIKLAGFPVLNAPLGSVRIGTSPIDPVTKKQTGLWPPTLINSGAGGEIYAMSAECTHEGCSVPRYDQQAGLMVCPCHGSHYAIDGTVVGGPAQQSLARYPVKNENGALAIQIPELFYEISAASIPEGGGRVAFTFLSFAHIQYQVFSRETLQGAETSVLFALTPDGAMSERIVDGIDDYVTVYLPRPRNFGFYEVAMVSQAV
jgi:nitrite reductase/ring-hydroxylating ferredoxin subunit